MNVAQDSQCLRHLILSDVSLKGKSFEQLLIDDAQRLRFREFIEASNDAWGRACKQTRERKEPHRSRSLLVFHVVDGPTQKRENDGKWSYAPRPSETQFVELRVMKFSEVASSWSYLTSKSKEAYQAPDAKPIAPPLCLRVSCRGSAGIRVGTDIYHVPVPGGGKAKRTCNHCWLQAPRAQTRPLRSETSGFNPKPGLGRFVKRGGMWRGRSDVPGVLFSG